MRPQFFSLIFPLAMAFLFQEAYSQQYSQVSIHVKDANPNDLFDLGFDVDHLQHEKDSFKFFVNQNELNQLTNLGYHFDIVISDYRSFFNKQRQEDLKELPNVTRGTHTASNFGYGSMGGFYTLTEIENKLDSMSILYPSIASPKYSIGQSIEGRDIWAVKISDNPQIDENEPVAYYDAMHHCREPLSMAVTINYMYWLLENYSSDSRVQYIVNNRELYFVPMVNPDGYEYNRQTDPNGGGLWRKNRRNNGSGCFGVDLNRNYSFEFGHNSSCASSNTCSNTYKGPSAFSEPETQAVMQFLDSISPKVAFSTHSTAGKYLMPYGFSVSPPQYDIYSEWGSDFLSDNDYIYGVTFEMLGYTSCGTTRDFLHSQGIYGWTPEIDGSGFWPQQSEIFSLVDENVLPLFYQAWIAGGYADFQSHLSNGDITPSNSFQIEVDIKNKGVGDSAYNVTAVLSINDPEIQILNNNLSFGSIAARERALATFNLQCTPNFAADSVTVSIDIFQDGVRTVTENFTLISGAKTQLFMDNAENGATNWVATGNGKSWGVNGDDSYSGSSSFGDSDNGNSANNTQNYLTLQNPITLNGNNQLWLSYAAKWSIEKNFDYARLNISQDGGATWSNLKSYTASSDWIYENIDLSNYSSAQNLSFQFELDTDGGEIGDGFYFDDFELSAYNTVPVHTPELGNLGLSIYPNPVQDYLQIVNHQNVISNVQITNIAGQEVYSKSYRGKTFEIDFSDFAPGSYYLIVNDERVLFVK
ncbi:MAG: T9SS type A sorting domain-containing protein [Flavobacteriales bacterium]|nr:T9SS type A sorting domain-containing protein [Flavobacteriales bacterium]